MATRIRSQDFMSELFSLLSHPTLIGVVATGLSIGVLTGAQINRPLAQFLIIFLIGSIVARALYVRSIQRRGLMLVGVVGLTLTSIGLVFDAQSVGTVSLTPQQRTESYLRGHDTPVQYHLGGTLKLDRDDQNIGITCKKNHGTLEYQRYLRGESLVINSWRFKLIHAHEDMKNPTVSFKFVHRETQAVELKTLRVGESQQVGDGMIVRLDRISNNPKTDKHPVHLQALLTMQWRTKDGEPQEKVVYLQSNFPELDERFGQSPYLSTIEGVTSTPIFDMEIRRNESQQLIQLGAIALLISLIGLAFYELNELRQNAKRKVA